MKKKKTSFMERPTFVKILSFFLALILWFFVAGDRQETPVNEIRRQFENIPLACRNLGDDLVVVEMVNNVTIFLQGIPVAFDGLTPADLEAYVDLNGKTEGRHEVRINATAPPGMSIVRIEPASTIVVLEDLITLQMPVEPQFRGENRAGMILDEVNFSPQHVFVQGPRNKVALIDKVVFYLDIEAATGRLQEEVLIHPVDSWGRVVNGVNISPDFADVEVSFVFPRKDIPVEVDLKENGVEVETVTVDPLLVSVQGPKNLLEETAVIYTEEIDLQDWPSGTAQEVPLLFPEGITPVRNEKVLVRIFLVEEE